jgi:hypothetical protein
VFERFADVLVDVASRDFVSIGAGIGDHPLHFVRVAVHAVVDNVVALGHRLIVGSLGLQAGFLVDAVCGVAPFPLPLALVFAYRARIVRQSAANT